MRRLWIGLGVLLGLVVLIVVAGFIALRSIDWNEYKQPITRIVQDATGRRLDLTGDIGLEIGLWPGISLSGVAFQNASWSAEPEMVRLETLVFQLRVLPLLRGVVDIASLELRGLEVLLETSEAGATNWTFEPPPAEAAPAAKEEKEEEVGESGFDIDLERLALRDGRLRIVDHAAGSERTIDIDHLLATPKLGSDRIELELAARADGQPFRLEGESSRFLVVFQGAAHDIDLTLTAGDGEASLKGRFDRSMDPITFDLVLSLRGERLVDWRPLFGAGLPALGAHRLSAKLAGTTERIGVDDLALEVGESRLAGRLDLTLTGDRPRLEAELSSPRLDLADFQAPGEAEDPAAPEPTRGEGPGDRLLSDAALPFDSLASVDAKLGLDIGRLRAGGMDLDDVDLTLELDQSRLEVVPLKLRLADGVVETRLEVDARREPARVSLKGEAKGLVAAKLLRDSELIDGGPMDLTWDVRGRGGSVAGIASRLDGQIALELKGVRVESTTAGVAFADLQSAMLGRSDVRSLLVECGVADFQFQKGIGQPSVLVFNLDSVALFGRGAIDLGEETIALHFDREAKGVSASRALPPFTVGGTFADPKTGVDALRLTGRAIDLGAEILTGDIILDWEDWPQECRALSAAYDRKRTEPSEASKLVRKGGNEALRALESLMRRKRDDPPQTAPADTKTPSGAVTLPTTATPPGAGAEPRSSE